MSYGAFVGILVVTAVAGLLSWGLVLACRSLEEPRVGGLGLPIVGVIGFVGGAIAAAAWLSWEVGYTRYPNGDIEGPYGFWQLVGTALTAAAVCLVAAGWANRIWAGVVAASAATILGYALAWGIIAAAGDDSGLFLVGMVYLIGGGGFALLCVGALVGGVRSLLARRSGSAGALRS